MDTADAEAVLVLLPEAQNGRAADPGQADLRGAINLSSIHIVSRSFIFLIIVMKIIICLFSYFFISLDCFSFVSSSLDPFMH